MSWITVRNPFAFRLLIGGGIEGCWLTWRPRNGVQAVVLKPDAYSKLNARLAPPSKRARPTAAAAAVAAAAAEVEVRSRPGMPRAGRCLGAVACLPGRRSRGNATQPSRDSVWAATR